MYSSKLKTNFRCLGSSFNKLSKKFYMQNTPSLRDNMKCYFDVSINNSMKGRIVFTLFAKDCPRTALNFYHLCKGDRSDESGKKLHYKGSKFHRVIPGFMSQGGDILNGNGTGSVSIYGKTFGDENFVFSHDQAGLISMANRGPNTNGSQFFITFADCGWLDGKHVVFGKISEGIEVLNEIEFTGSSSGKTKSDVVIEDCGVLEEKKENVSETHQSDSHGHNLHKH